MTHAPVVTTPNAHNNGDMRRLLTAIGLAAGFATLAGAGGGIYWLISVQTSAAAVDRWIDAMLASGYDINVAQQRFDGFPRNVDVVLDGFEVSGRNHSFPWTWTIPRVRISHSLTDSRITKIRPSGVQTIVYSDNDERKTIRLGSTRLVMAVVHSPEGGVEATVDVAGFVWAPEKQKSVTIGRLHADVLMPEDDGAIPRGTHVFLNIQDVELPGKRAFGNSLKTLKMAVEFQVAVPAGNPWQALEHWFENDGIAELSDGSLKWGALEVAGIVGNVGVDYQLRPEANLTGQFRNFADTVEDLFVAQRITARRRDDILSVLKLAHNRDRTEFEYPFIIQGGSALIDGTRVGQVPRFLPWRRPD